MLRVLLLALLALAVPWEALAADFTNCSGQSESRRVVGNYQRICYELAATEGTDSGPFRVFSESALICLKSNVGSETPGAVRVHPRRCIEGLGASTGNCFTMLDAPLDGTQGGSTTQNACLRVGPGQYFLNVTTPVGAGEAAVIEIKAESKD